MFLPALIVAIGFVGSCLCLFLFFLSRDKSARTPAVPESDINRDLRLEAYSPTIHPDIHLDKTLPQHPFKVVKNGIFCGDCLITNAIRHSDGGTLVHTHNCTVIRKEWKVVICKDAVKAEYFISLDRPHFRKA